MDIVLGPLSTCNECCDLVLPSDCQALDGMIHCLKPGEALRAKLNELKTIQQRISSATLTVSLPSANHPPHAIGHVGVMGLSHSKPIIPSNEELIALRNEILHLSNEVFNIQRDINITTYDRLCGVGTGMTGLPPPIQIPSHHPNGRKLTRTEKKQAAVAAEAYREGIVMETYRARAEAKRQMLSFKRDLAQSRNVVLCLRRRLDQTNL